MDFSFANAWPEKAHFFKVNQELIKALHDKELQQHEHQIQELHFMKCPKCGHDLRHTKFGEMVVDRCSSCEGVFFDKDEFNQLFGAPDSHESFIDTLHTLLVGEERKA